MKPPFAEARQKLCASRKLSSIERMSNLPNDMVEHVQGRCVVDRHHIAVAKIDNRVGAVLHDGHAMTEGVTTAIGGDIDTVIFAQGKVAVEVALTWIALCGV